MSFGFGVGDFLTVARMAMDICDALDERNGAVADYKALCETLLSLNSAIRSAHEFFLCPSNSLDNLDGICRELECCKRLMEKFLENYQSYTVSLLKQRSATKWGSGNAWKNVFKKRPLQAWPHKDTWKKITWKSKAEDVRKLQANLQLHLSAFTVLSHTVLQKSVHRIERKAMECSEISQRIETGVSEMLVPLKKLTNNIRFPNKFECMGGEEPIYFEDALGRAISLPAILCSKDRFHEVLRIIFKDVPGEKMITHKEYRITDLEGALIQDGDWDSKVVPGARIAMSILMRARTAVHRCPRCGRSSAGANPVEGGLRCHSCCLIFQTFENRIEELPDSPSGFSPKMFTEEMTLVTSRTKENRNREEYCFRRIHYLPPGSDFLCPVPSCGQRFERSDYLDAHARTHDGDDVPNPIENSQSDTPPSYQESNNPEGPNDAGTPQSTDRSDPSPRSLKDGPTQVIIRIPSFPGTSDPFVSASDSPYQQFYDFPQGDLVQVDGSYEFTYDSGAVDIGVRRRSIPLGEKSFSTGERDDDWGPLSWIPRRFRDSMSI